MVNAKQKRQPYPFFNGWGMTSKSIEHLTAENARTHTFDCLHFFDYQNREVPQSNFSGYAKIYLIAWSMGVYMSSLLQLPFTKKNCFLRHRKSHRRRRRNSAKNLYPHHRQFFRKNASPVFQKNRFCHGYEPFRNRIAARAYCDTRL